MACALHVARLTKEKVLEMVDRWQNIRQQSEQHQRQQHLPETFQPNSSIWCCKQMMVSPQIAISPSKTAPPLHGMMFEPSPPPWPLPVDCFTRAGTRNGWGRRGWLHVRAFTSWLDGSRWVPHFCFCCGACNPHRHAHTLQQTAAGTGFDPFGNGGGVGSLFFCWLPMYALCP